MSIDADLKADHKNEEEPEVGSLIADRYRILEVAGRGGMGVVYKAEQVHMSRVVALKMLLRDHTSHAQAFKRFQQEARAASLLNHPNIVAIHDFGIIAGTQAYLAMDFLDGVGLNTVIKTEGAMSPARFERIFSQACDALAHAHEHGVVHRDIKPSNFIIGDRGDEKDYLVIVDFGLVKLMRPDSETDVKLTSTDMLVGSPLYMSPEQCRGLTLDQRTDIYSLGCVMYEALTGTPPMIGQTAIDTLYKHISEPPPPMSQTNPDCHVTPILEGVVLRALSKDPQSRQSSMAELKTEILDAVRGKLSAAAAASALSARSAGTAAAAGAKIKPRPIAARSIESWFWLLTLPMLLVAVVVGSLLLIIDQQRAQIAWESRKLAEETKKEKTDQAWLAERAKRDASRPATVAAVRPPVPHHNAEPSPFHKAKHLQANADALFAQRNWQAAFASYKQAIDIEDSSLNQLPDLYVPATAYAAVSAWRSGNEAAAVDYLNRFSDAYLQYPEKLPEDEGLIDSLLEMNRTGTNLQLQKQLLLAAISVHDKRVPTANEQALVLRGMLADVYKSLGDLPNAELVLRQVLEHSQRFPRMHATAAEELVGVLKAQNKTSEAQQLEMQKRPQFFFNRFGDQRQFGDRSRRLFSR